MDDVKQRKTNLITFRASAPEIALLSALKQRFKYDHEADVIHQIMATFVGVEGEREKVKLEIREKARVWQIKSHECPICTK